MKNLIKPDDLLDFINWIKTKPLDAYYDYGRAQNCPIAQYLKDRGYAGISVQTLKVYFDHFKREASLPEPLDNLVRDTPRTYGRLLHRAVVAYAEIMPPDQQLGIDFRPYLI